MEPVEPVEAVEAVVFSLADRKESPGPSGSPFSDRDPETLATFSSSWSSTSSALWSSVNQTQSAQSGYGRIWQGCWWMLWISSALKKVFGRAVDHAEFPVPSLNRSPMQKRARPWSCSSQLRKQGPVLQLLPGVLERLWLHLRPQPIWENRECRSYVTWKNRHRPASPSCCQVITSDIVSILEASIAGDSTARGIQFIQLIQLRVSSNLWSILENILIHILYIVIPK